MTVHDLIQIYARETCDQDTAVVFEEFMRRALKHTDHILAVSENTARDVRRYSASLQLPEPAITVTKNGSSFTEFLPPGEAPGEITVGELPERFVLFVATIEGRKNHQLILDVWRRMIEEGDDPPHLVCVGRLAGNRPRSSAPSSRAAISAAGSIYCARSAMRISGCCTADPCLRCARLSTRDGACRSARRWRWAKSASAATALRCRRLPANLACTSTL